MIKHLRKKKRVVHQIPNFILYTVYLQTVTKGEAFLKYL